MNRRDVPAPDLGGTDPDEVLRSRLMGTTVGTGTPVSTPPTPAHTQPAPRVRARTGTGTRPDPDGMKRISLYVTASAATALEQAADHVLAALGDDVPRHVALSALLDHAARHAPEVTTDLVQRRADELAERLAALRNPDTAS